MLSTGPSNGLIGRDGQSDGIGCDGFAAAVLDLASDLHAVHVRLGGGGGGGGSVSRPLGPALDAGLFVVTENLTLLPAVALADAGCLVMARGTVTVSVAVLEVTV